MRTNLEFWLVEQDVPMGRFNVPQQQPQPEQPQNMDMGQQPQGQGQGQPQDFTQDPQSPDVPEAQEPMDFQSWKIEFFDLAIRGDANQLIDALNEVRDTDLAAPDRKFVEDNMQVMFLRQDANIDKASKEVRKLIKQELDRANPANTVMQHITNTLEAYPSLNEVFVKLCGLYALKGDMHRKFMAALTGAIQVGGAGDKEDLIYPEKDYTINFSTRFYTDYGNVAVGDWSPQEDDARKYLSEPEAERLEEGSPEERQVLRNRVVLESIAERFRNRAFLIHIMNPADGTLHAIGWDVAECLRQGYQEGKFVVRPKKGVAKNAMFTLDGALVPLNELSIFYVRQTENDIQGTITKREVPFMERRDGKLYLIADVDTVQEVTSAVPGFYFKDMPYQGNPSDIPTMMRCVPSAVEMLLRRC